MINFYSNVFNRGSHILSPLNDLAAAAAKPKEEKSQRYVQNIESASRSIQVSKRNDIDRSKTSVPRLQQIIPPLY